MRIDLTRKGCHCCSVGGPCERVRPAGRGAGRAVTDRGRRGADRFGHDTAVATFPAPPCGAIVPATEQDRDALIATLLAAPFTVEEERAARSRRLGLTRLLDWLAEHPGDMTRLEKIPQLCSVKFPTL